MMELFSENRSYLTKNSTEYTLALIQRLECANTTQIKSYKRRYQRKLLISTCKTDLGFKVCLRYDCASPFLSRKLFKICGFPAALTH